MRLAAVRKLALKCALLVLFQYSSITALEVQPWQSQGCCRPILKLDQRGHTCLVLLNVIIYLFIYLIYRNIYILPLNTSNKKEQIR